MVITVDLAAGAGTVGLDDPADCKKFHLAATGAPDEAALGSALAVSGVGRMHDGHALIDIAALRRLAAGRVPEGWEADFEGMLGYARTKGWVQADAVQAHVEWSEA